MRDDVRSAGQHGASLIEAMIALIVLAFGTLALAGMQSTLLRNSNVARQRIEALRLGQEKLESLRSFTAIVSNGGTAWNDFPENGVLASDQIAPGDKYADGLPVTSNTVFYRTWQLGGSIADGMRPVTVTVSWIDSGAVPNSTAQRQSVTLSTVISKTDPAYIGSLGFPLPANTNLKRPKNRSLNIPVPAISLKTGKSAYQLTNNFAVIFSNDSGYVVQRCNFRVTTDSDLSSCVSYPAYIVAGYVSRSGSGDPWPTGLNTGSVDNGGAGDVSCMYGDAVNQNSPGDTISNYKYYLCVVPVSLGQSWSGKILLGGLSTSGQVIVCRFQYPSENWANNNERNEQPYVTVKESLDNQNYYVTTSKSSGSSVGCPTISGLATTLHQDCRASGTDSISIGILKSSCPTSTPNAS